MLYLQYAMSHIFLTIRTKPPSRWPKPQPALQPLSNFGNIFNRKEYALFSAHPFPLSTAACIVSFVSRFTTQHPFPSCLFISFLSFFFRFRSRSQCSGLFSRFLGSDRTRAVVVSSCAPLVFVSLFVAFVHSNANQSHPPPFCSLASCYSAVAFPAPYCMVYA